ncbi:hypothetical protein MBLNU459_g0077t1 [Dothideomycetes sp. NU459]
MAEVVHGGFFGSDLVHLMHQVFGQPDAGEANTIQFRSAIILDDWMEDVAGNTEVVIEPSTTTDLGSKQLVAILFTIAKLESDMAFTLQQRESASASATGDDEISGEKHSELDYRWDDHFDESSGSGDRSPQQVSDHSTEVFASSSQNVRESGTTESQPKSFTQSQLGSIGQTSPPSKSVIDQTLHGDKSQTFHSSRAQPHRKQPLSLTPSLVMEFATSSSSNGQQINELISVPSTIETTPGLVVQTPTFSPAAVLMADTTNSPGQVGSSMSDGPGMDDLMIWMSNNNRTALNAPVLQPAVPLASPIVEDVVKLENLHHMLWPLLHLPTFNSDITVPSLVQVMTKVQEWVQQNTVPYPTMFDIEASKQILQNFLQRRTEEINLLSGARTISLSSFQTVQALGLLASCAVSGDDPVAIEWAVWCSDTCISYLRQMGVFQGMREIEPSPRTADERWIMEEQFKRLAATFVRIDAFIGLIFDRAPTLRWPEMKITFPASDTIWRADTPEERHSKDLGEGVVAWSAYLLDMRVHMELNHNLEANFFALGSNTASFLPPFHHPANSTEAAFTISICGTNLTLYHLLQLSMFANLPVLETDEKQDLTPRLVILFAAMAVAVFCGALDMNSIAAAVPSITNSLGDTEDEAWYGTAYYLALSCCQMAWTQIYKAFPAKLVFFGAFLFFEAGALVSALAPNSMGIIIGRTISGAGISGSFIGAWIIVSYVVPLRYRPLASAFFSIIIGSTQTAGPVIGGALTTRLSWRWCFWVNLPIGGFAVLLALLGGKIKDPQSRRDGRTPKQVIRDFDLFGFTLWILAVICLTVLLQFGGSKYAWNSGPIVTLFIMTVLFVGGFAVVQKQQGEKSLAPLRIMKQRSLACSAFYILMMQAAKAQLTYFVSLHQSCAPDEFSYMIVANADNAKLPIFFQAVRGTSALQSGLNTIPNFLSFVIASISASIAVTWLGYYTPFMLVGSALGVAGTALLSMLTVSTPTARWIGYQILTGGGFGIGFNGPQIAAQTVFQDHRDTPTAMTIITSFMDLGGSLGISIGGAILSSRVRQSLHALLPDLTTKQISEAGLTGLQALVAPDKRQLVAEAYASGVSAVFYATTSLSAATILLACGVEWRSIKDKYDPTENDEEIEKSKKERLNLRNKIHAPRRDTSQKSKKVGETMI